MLGAANTRGKEEGMEEDVIKCNNCNSSLIAYINYPDDSESKTMIINCPFCQSNTSVKYTGKIYCAGMPKEVTNKPTQLLDVEWQENGMKVEVAKV